MKSLSLIGIFSALILSSAAHAAPANSEVVWNVKGKATYTPPSGIFWGVTRVQEDDGSTLSIGCQSGPFTPHEVDGRAMLSDITAGKINKYGRQGPNTGTKEYTRRYANGAEECDQLVQWFAKEINKRHGARIVLDSLSGSVSIMDRD